MKRYHIKCETGRTEYMDILAEDPEGYLVRLTKIKDGDERIFEEPLSRRLFEACLKTGYIYENENFSPPAA
ncbi:MAG: hypothetical protein LBD37_05590 [Treponema sp.]|jgi:hypothetical protein|nr:hypothetical protein [Treponema sp.]